MAKRFHMIVMMVVLAGFAEGRTEAGFVLTANSAGSQSSTVAGVTTESFDGFKPGQFTSLTTTVGTLSSPGMAVVAADQYGGAGGKGNYFSIGAQSGQNSAVLTLNGPEAYFGFWWSAADSQNEVEFLSGGKVIATFTTAAAFGNLGPAYAGNPNGGDSGEKFAYINFIGTGGSTFDQVDFLNSNTGTGFESDNWSVRATPLDPGSYPGAPGVVPEPSSLALTVAGLLGCVGLARSRRKR